MGELWGNVIEVVKREAHAKHKIPTIKFVSQPSYCKGITTRLHQIQSAVRSKCAYPSNSKKCQWTSS